MSKEREIQNCQALIERLFPGAQSRVFYAEGGILAEVVHQSITDANVAAKHRRVFEEMIEFNGQHELDERFVFHKLFLYPQAERKYQVGAMLHTRAADYNENGIFTSYLSAGDAQVWLSELDSEVLQFGFEAPFEFEIIAGEIPNPIFSIQEHAGYKQIGVRGGYYPIISLTKVHEGVWRISVS
jgi:hypothetical protein